MPTGKGHVWVEPEIVCEVRFKERTDEGLLRHPVFLRFREDKPPAECVCEDGAAIATEVEPVVEAVDEQEKTVPLSNLDKVFWPEEGYTKGDLIEYYRAISPWLLPYLQGPPDGA